MTKPGAKKGVPQKDWVKKERSKKMKQWWKDNKDTLKCKKRAKRISDTKKGIKFTIEHRRKLSKVAQMRKKSGFSEERKQKLREKALKRAMELRHMNVGKNEVYLLDELEKFFKCRIIRQYNIVGYSLDGYIPELNIAIEIDELHHFDIEGVLKEEDILRQQRIEKALGCRFLRIKDNI